MLKLLSLCLILAVATGCQIDTSGSDPYSHVRIIGEDGSTANIDDVVETTDGNAPTYSSPQPVYQEPVAPAYEEPASRTRDFDAEQEAHRQRTGFYD